MRDVEKFKNAVISVQHRIGGMFVPNVKQLFLDSVYLVQLVVKQSEIV